MSDTAGIDSENIEDSVDDEESQVKEEYEDDDGYVRPEPETVHDEMMLALLDEVCGSRIYTYVSVDMDRDGINEMVGITDDDDYGYYVWYCSGDLNDYYEVMPVMWFDHYNIEVLDLGDEIHIAVDGANMLGTGKSYSILALHDGQIEVLVNQHYGYVYMNDNQDIVLDVEAYDAMYDKTDDLWLGHTWTDTYLYYEDGEYKEYGAAMLPEEEFLEYDNAEELIGAIERENRTEDTIEIRYTYYIRENSILHIQCEDESDDYIEYYHYTLRIRGNRLDGELSKNSGIISYSLSWLDNVTFPD